MHIQLTNYKYTCRLTFMPQNLGGPPAITILTSQRPVPCPIPSQHLLRGDLRSGCRHGTGDLKMKGVVGPGGARFELEGRLPQGEFHRVRVGRAQGGDA